MTILVSACLVGINCRYNGDNNYHQGVVDYLDGKRWIPICPEQLGGLGTPRFPAEIENGTGKTVLNCSTKVVTESGNDLTNEFIKGAEEALKIVKLTGANMAILKERSPSCGSKEIYDGAFQKRLKQGAGVTATLFKDNGIRILSEDDLSK